MKLSRHQVNVLLLAALTLGIAAVTNIATNEMPESFRPYLWLAWPVLGVLVLVFLVLTHRGNREGDDVGPRFSLKDYYTALKNRYQSLDLDALTPPQKEEYLQLRLRSVFVEQSVRENPPPVELPKEVWERLQREGDIHPDDLPEGVTLEDVRRTREVYSAKPQTPVLDVLTSPQHRRLIILGDPGSGKSTLARYILLSLIDSTGDRKLRNAFKDHIPLLIELRTFIGLREEQKCDTFLEFLEYLGKTEGWHLTQAALHQHLGGDGRAVVIFDGLDEIFDPEDRERITHQIVGFASNYTKAHILITSRVIGYRRAILTEAGFAHFTLQDLDESQVETFVRRWYELALSSRPEEARARIERIMQSFKHSASIRQLAGNPMLLTIMAIIGKHQELPRERWKLYDHAASVLIQHWDVNKHLEDLSIEADFVEEEDKKELLRRIAYKMQGGAGGLAGNYMHREQLQGEFEAYLIERYGKPPDQAAAIARSMINQFRTRNFILSLYGANLYGFVHRAFLEYFCATAFIYKFEKSRELTPEQLNDEVFGAHWEDQSWHEVLRLICGMVDERFADGIIRYLVTKAYKPWPGDFEKKLPWNIILGAQCLSEIRNLNTVAEAVGLLLKASFDVFAFMMSQAHTNRLSKAWTENPVRRIASLGAVLPNRGVLTGLLEGYGSYEFAWVHVREFGDFVGSIGTGLEDVHQQLIKFASSEDKNHRVLAPFTLAIGWQNDPQTLSIIRHMTDDNDEHVRERALSSLTTYYSNDPETLSLLLDRLEKDPSDSVRFTAVLASPRKVNESSRVFPLLLNLATKDKFNLVRYFALDRLTKYGFDERVESILYDRTKNDESSLNRYLTARLLLSYSSDKKKTVTYLRERAVKDTDDVTRIQILELLTGREEDTARTVVLLRERAEKDPSEYVRDRAVELLRGLESKS